VPLSRSNVPKVLVGGPPLAITPSRSSETTADVPPAQGGERQRLAELYDAYAPLVAWFAGRLLLRREDVEDLVQEVFVIAAENLDNLTEAPKIRAWLKTVTLRRVGRRLRWARVRARFGVASVTSDSVEDLIASPEASPEDRAALRELYVLLGKLPVDLRIAWTLRHVHEESLEAVAVLTGCSLATAKRRISAAQQRIQKDLRDD
jgi:RNA polymerase sigma-70 factor, ECF subfamily